MRGHRLDHLPSVDVWLDATDRHVHEHGQVISKIGERGVTLPRARVGYGSGPIGIATPAACVASSLCSPGTDSPGVRYQSRKPRIAAPMIA